MTVKTKFHYVFRHNELEMTDALIAAGVKRVALSYGQMLDCPDDRWEQVFRLFGKHRVSLMVDAGGLWAYRHGLSLSLEYYMDFIERFSKYITVAANLDAVADSETTYKNWIRFQERMRVLGIEPMMVFHDYDHRKWLGKYILEDQPLIAVSGGLEPMVWRRKLLWIEGIFRTIEKVPGARLHAEAMHAPDILRRFGFYSADSDVWDRSARQGKIHTPVLEFRSVAVTEKPKNLLGHLKSLDKHERDRIEEHCERAGFPLAELASSENKRRLYNIGAFREFEMLLNDRR